MCDLKLRICTCMGGNGKVCALEEQSSCSACIAITSKRGLFDLEKRVRDWKEFSTWRGTERYKEAYYE